MSKKPETKAIKLVERTKRRLAKTEAFLDEINILENRSSDASTSASDLTNVKSRPLLASERSMQNQPKSPAPAADKPTSGGPAVSGTSGGKATSAETVEACGTVRAAIPDSWEDTPDEVVVEHFNKVLKTEQAVVNVGAGGRFRKLTTSVHHLDPTIIPADAVKKAFRAAEFALPAGHSKCEHRLGECDCVDDDGTSLVEGRPLVFFHSAYYLTEDDLCKLDDNVRLYMVFKYANSSDLVMSFEDGWCDAVDMRTGQKEFSHPDHRWLMNHKLLKDGRTYCVQILKRGKSAVCLKATIANIPIDKRVSAVGCKASKDAGTVTDTVKAERDEIQEVAESIVVSTDPKSRNDAYLTLNRSVASVMRRVKGATHAKALRAVRDALITVRSGHQELAKVATDDRLNRFLLGYDADHGLKSPIDPRVAWCAAALVVMSIGRIGLGVYGRPGVTAHKPSGLVNHLVSLVTLSGVIAPALGFMGAGYFAVKCPGAYRWWVKVRQLQATRDLLNTVSLQ